MTLEEAEILYKYYKENPRVQAMGLLVGSNRCDKCKEFRRETILFDVRKTSAAIAICPACLLEILKTTEYMKNANATNSK